MGIGWICWLGLLGLVGIIWASRHLAVNRAKRNDIPLSSGDVRSWTTVAPRLSVLVAAKDEQANIETCIRTMLDQDYPNYEIIAIDDRSIDRTPQILDQLVEAYPDRLKVIHVTDLKEGWFGKNNAMRVGMEQASGEWICFIDADCRQTSGHTLSVAMQFAIQQNIDFLSVLPVLETYSFWERVLQPVCAAIMVMWFRPERVNDPKSPAAYANGAFMLLKRTTYDALGGHEHIKSQVNEDIHLARLTKQAGWRLYVIGNDDLYRTRMYTNFKQAWNGWSRIFYGSFGTFKKLLISTIVLFLASLFPMISFLTSATALLLTTDEDNLLRMVMISSGVVLVIQHSLLYRFYQLTRSDPRYLISYVLGALVALGMLIKAMSKLSGRTTTTWRGTTYRGSKLESTATKR